MEKTRNLPEDSNPILIHQTLAVTKATNYSLIDPFLNSNHNHLSNHNQRWFLLFSSMRTTQSGDQTMREYIKKIEEVADQRKRVHRKVDQKLGWRWVGLMAIEGEYDGDGRGWKGEEELRFSWVTVSVSNWDFLTFAEQSVWEGQLLFARNFYLLPYLWKMEYFNENTVLYDDFCDFINISIKINDQRITWL